MAICQWLTFIYRKLINEPLQTQILEDYWQKHTRFTDNQSIHKKYPIDSAVSSDSSIGNAVGGSGPVRNPSSADSAAFLPADRSLLPHHPARSLPKLLETFGPLIFPIYRAALLRRRILIVGNAPLHEMCNFGKCIVPYRTLFQPLRY